MATKQTTIPFNIRKPSSRHQASTKYLNEKENEPITPPPLRRSSRASNALALSVESTLSNSEEGNDGLSNAGSSLPKVQSPSKRKIKDCKEWPSPPKVTCQAEVKSELTPSTRLTGLTLSSPESKPASCAKKSPGKLSQKELFPSDEDHVDKAFQKARLAFHTSSTENLPGREKELAELKEFLLNHIKNRSSGSIYISGPPGTGKTACLTYLMKQKEIKGYFLIVYINCTSMKSPGAIYSHIVSQLHLKVKGRPCEKTYLNAIERFLASRLNRVLFVFDELDQLESRSQSVLYTIFEWPITHPEGLVLVGIANALDLTDRTLPRLRAREDLAPKLLHFAPYSKQQIINILKIRLEDAGVGDVFSAPALQLLASKVATVSGDVRRALDIGRRVIEMTGNPFLNNPQPVPVKAVLKTSENHILTLSGQKSPTKTEAILTTNSPIRNASPAKFGSPLRLSSPAKLRSPKKTLLSPSKRFVSPSKTNSTAPVSKADSPRRASSRKLFQSPVKRTVDVKGVLTVVGEVYGTSQSLNNGTDELPLQQRLAVCTLLLILKNGKSKDVTVAKLHEVYRRVCNKRRFDPLDQAAFLSILSLIEARGLLSIQGKGKPSRLSKVCLQWVEDEVISALKDKELLSSILSDVACLS